MTKKKTSIDDLAKILLRSRNKFKIKGEDSRNGTKYSLYINDNRYADIGRAWYDKTGEVRYWDGGYFIAGQVEDKDYNYRTFSRKNVVAKNLFDKVEKKYFKLHGGDEK